MSGMSVTKPANSRCFSEPYLQNQLRAIFAGAMPTSIAVPMMSWLAPLELAFLPRSTAMFMSRRIVRTRNVCLPNRRDVAFWLTDAAG